MNESLRISCRRVDEAFERQDRDYPQLLNDAHKLMQYARHASAMIKGGDTAITQLESMADAYRLERDAAHHVIIEAGIEPVKDTHCNCDECQSVLKSMQAAGYAAD